MNDIIETEEVVAARGVKVVFGAVKALDGADLIIRAGECLGLVGHNGAGKSTIVNVINGGLTPHEGTISYGGAPVGRAFRQHAQAVFAAYSRNYPSART